MYVHSLTAVTLHMTGGQMYSLTAVTLHMTGGQM